LKYFRAVVGLHDDNHNRHLIDHDLFKPILKILFDTMPRDNLLNSACLELFEFIKRDNIKTLVHHLVETYRDKFQNITYVETFQNLILRYDQMHETITTQEIDASFTSVDSETPSRPLGMVNGGKWGQGLKEVDPDEEAYFNGSDDEDDLPNTPKSINGASPAKPLVNYPDDDDDEDEMDILASAPDSMRTMSTSSTQTRSSSQTLKSSSRSPPERISEKRRREEDAEDELLANLASSGPKRRASLNSNSSVSSLKSLRRKNTNMASTKENAGPKKLSLALPLKSGGEGANSK
jgi:protein phosphatase-4 regulatory subunit 3